MRIIPLKLQQLHILKRRSILSESESKEYNKLQSGYLGELEFDKILDGYLTGLEVYHLKDYRFKVNTSEEVQIDNLLISGDRI